MNLLAAADLTPAELRRLSPRIRRRLLAEVGEFLRQDWQMNQLLRYQPLTEECRQVHRSTAREVGIQGGNKSGKTGVMLAEGAIQMTGLVPESLRADYPLRKLRAPIRVRLVVTSLTSAWDINLKPKLQWWEWNGGLGPEGVPGDPACGHWGLIPRRFLINGDWERSWSEKHRLLTLTNGSTVQVMSHDQSLTDFNQGAFHLILEDELPPEEIHRANRIRAMEFGGQILVGGTPPDDRSGAIGAAWFFDQLIAPGLAGVEPDQVGAVVLWTEQNPTLSPSHIEAVGRGLTPEQRRSRFHGESIHLAGLIIRGFTEKPRPWCARCEGPVLAIQEACGACGASPLQPYSHVWTEEDLAWPGPGAWPVLFYMDPHQARPTACGWFKVDPEDALWQIAELEIEGDAATVKRQVEAFERTHALAPLWRKGDPKMTEQSNQFAQTYEGQPFTIRRAFEDVGFYFEDANTAFGVGIDRIEGRLRVNPLTGAPGLRIHTGCRQTIYQVSHFTYQPGSRRDDYASRGKPSRKHSDFPALLRYIANDEPTWRGCQALARAEPVRVAKAGTGRNAVTGW